VALYNGCGTPSIESDEVQNGRDLPATPTLSLSLSN